jgi:hypothetical protein
MPAVLNKLPNVAVHVVKAECVGEQRTDWCREDVAVVTADTVGTVFPFVTEV